MHIDSPDRTTDYLGSRLQSFRLDTKSRGQDRFLENIGILAGGPSSSSDCGNARGTQAFGQPVRGEQPPKLSEVERLGGPGRLPVAAKIVNHTRSDRAGAFKLCAISAPLAQTECSPQKIRVCT
jgi:hypothetical protein